MFACYAFAVLGVIVLFAYTQRHQGATMYWAKRISEDDPQSWRGMQDAITPWSQTLRNYLLFLFVPTVIVGGIVLYRWYTGVAAGVAVLFGSGVISVLFLPGYTAPYWYKRIMNQLKKRQRRYYREEDILRLAAIDEVIARLERAVSRPSSLDHPFHRGPGS